MAVMLVAVGSLVKQMMGKNILNPDSLGNGSNVNYRQTATPNTPSVESIVSMVQTMQPTPIPIIQTVIVPQIQYIEVTPTPKPNVYPGRYSWYWPPLGGINCDRDSSGNEECEYMANGEKWISWVNIGAACPVEWAFGTQIKIIEANVILTCVDRGGAIVRESDGVYWIDQLTENPIFYWSKSITIEVLN